MSINTAEIRRLAYYLLLQSRRRARSALLGGYQSYFKGRGLEFAELSEYQPEDEARYIDWAASLRSERLYKRVYSEERELPLVLALDVSASMCIPKLKQTLVQECVALLAYCAAFNQDNCQLFCFSDHLEKQLPPGRGEAFAARLLTELLAFNPGSRKTNLSGLCSSLNRCLPHYSRIFIFSDLDDQNYQSALQALSCRHEVIVACPENPELPENPDGIYLEMTDAESSEVRMISPGDNGPALEKMQQKRLLVRQAQADWLPLRLQQSAVANLQQFFLSRS